MLILLCARKSRVATVLVPDTALALTIIWNLVECHGRAYDRNAGPVLLVLSHADKFTRKANQRAVSLTARPIAGAGHQVQPPRHGPPLSAQDGPALLRSRQPPRPAGRPPASLRTATRCSSCASRVSLGGYAAHAARPPALTEHL